MKNYQSSIPQKGGTLASHKKVTHQVLPSVSITPKSMTYRDTAYLKPVSNFSDSGDDPIGDCLQNKVVSIHRIFLFSIIAEQIFK